MQNGTSKLSTVDSQTVPFAASDTSRERGEFLTIRRDRPEGTCVVLVVFVSPFTLKVLNPVMHFSFKASFMSFTVGKLK